MAIYQQPVFLVNNHVEKGLPTPTTTTKQNLKTKANQKHNLRNTHQKASGAFLFNYNNQRKKKDNPKKFWWKRRKI
jgi:hypothetical protein